MTPRPGARRVAHLTTIDLSLRYLLYPQLRAIRAGGDDVVGISAPGPDVAWLEDRGIRHVALTGSTRGWSLRADVVAARNLYRFLRRERPDVLHTHNPKPGVYGRIVGRLAGVPVIVNTVHGLYASPDDSAPRRAAVYVLEAIASRCSDAELVQNPEDLEVLRRWRISAPDKTTFLSNGVDLARFRPGTPDERRRARAAMGVEDDEIVVGFVGRLVAEKGIPELLEAGAQLPPPFRLVVVGPDDPEKPDALPHRMLADATADDVRFLGRRDDVDDLYRGFDIFCLPSHREGLPRSAMEAAASALPVVATDIRGCRQVVTAGDNGYLVPVGDPTALAAALRRLADPRRRAELGAAGRRRAQEEFDEALVVARVLASYDRAAARRQRRVERAKRVVDVMGASVGLVVLAPVLAAIAVVVRGRLGAPVLFHQARPGVAGQLFVLHKFRTMRGDTDATGALLGDEDRVDRFGATLRATSLDELPQLWNVLVGEMSLVGPRPLLPEYLDRYTEEQARRHEVRPGLTGLAQVNGRTLQSWDDQLADDVRYVDQRTLVLDARILGRTVRQVLRRAGTGDGGVPTRPLFAGSPDTQRGPGVAIPRNGAGRS